MPAPAAFFRRRRDRFLKEQAAQGALNEWDEREAGDDDGEEQDRDEDAAASAGAGLGLVSTVGHGDTRVQLILQRAARPTRP